MEKEKNTPLDLNGIFALPDGNKIPPRPPDTEEGERLSWVLCSFLQTDIYDA
jgi:hypothetical protein